MPGANTDPTEPRTINGRLALQLLVAALLVFVCWRLRDIVILCFGAVLIAAFLRGIADALAGYTGWPTRLAIPLVLLALVAGLTAAFWLTGQPLLQQLQELRSSIPRAWASALSWVRSQPFGSQMLSSTGGADFQVPWERVAGVASASAAAIADVVLVLLLGIYLAFDPQLYRDGFLRLLKPAQRASIGEALTESASALQRWLIGQGLTMLIVGVTVGIGLSILGMPLASAMGLITGVFEFVPVFGAIASALLGTLLAFAQGPQQALYVALFFIVIQQLEGNVISPLVQRWAVHLPPVLSLLAVVAFGTLFGAAGIVLGTPLMVVVVVLVRKLWVERLDRVDTTHI